MTLRHLRAFVVVAHHGSFKLAARELSRTQPAISLAVQQLEDYVGLKLLERTTRRVAPTIEGERFIPIAERLIRDFDSAIFDLNATAERRSGHVSIAVLPSIATTLLPTIVKSFTELYPGISIHMIDDNSRGVQRRLARNEVDFSIGSRWRTNQGLEFRPLLQDRIEMICHRDHPLAKVKGPVKWKALEEHRFLDSGLRGLLPLDSVVDDPRFEFSTTTTLFAMVRANIGVAVLPTLATPADDPDLVSRPLIDPISRREICLITRKEWTLSPASEAMIEVLLAGIPGIIQKLGREHVKSRIRPGDFKKLSQL
ncbi:MAG: LysR family transcriptional regulator [Woeseiaceae bacterium]